MTFTELHNKPIAKESEDLFTSNIWGLLSFLPPEYTVVAIASAVSAVNGDQLGNIENVINCKMYFWPKINLGEYANHKGHTEPDVIVIMDHIDGSYSVVVVEAKHMMIDKSSGYVASQKEVIDQLAREYIVAAEDRFYSVVDDGLLRRRKRKSYLIYNTGHDALPKASFEESKKSLREKYPAKYDHNVAEMFWLPWWKMFEDLNRCSPDSESASRIVSHIKKMFVLKGYHRFSIDSWSLDIRFSLKSDYLIAVTDESLDNYNISLTIDRFNWTFDTKIDRSYDLSLKLMTLNHKYEVVNGE